MTAPQAINLINAGGTDNLRRKIKKYAIPERIKFLNSCIPYLSQNKKAVYFFREHFSKEIGACLMAESNLDKAIEIYNKAVK
jgi:hypothetical protein